MVIFMLIDGYIDAYWWLYWWLLMIIDGYWLIDDDWWLFMDILIGYGCLFMVILMVIGSILAWFKLNGPRPLRRNCIAEIATSAVSRSKPVGEDVAGYLTWKNMPCFSLYIYTVYIYYKYKCNTHTYIIIYIYYKYKWTTHTHIYTYIYYIIKSTGNGQYIM